MAAERSLAGTVVLVTGASSGIGRSAALAFARRGARVAAMARNAEKLDDLAAKARAAGGEVLAVPGDVALSDDCERTVARTVQALGRLDWLVNNAGINEYKTFASQDIAAIEAIVRTNLLGVVYMTKAALPAMRAQGRGHIVNVASVAGLIGVPGMAAYCASKFAVVGLTESLRVELRGTGVTLTAFCPGTVDTPMAAQPLKELGLPSKLAKSADDVAERIVRACIKRTPEVVYGEVPSFVLKLSRFFPRLTDWANFQIMRRARPKALGL